MFICLKYIHQFEGRRHSPSPARLTPEPSVEKDEGISDEEDPAELRILLELNEQVSLDLINNSKLGINYFIFMPFLIFPFQKCLNAYFK